MADEIGELDLTAQASAAQTATNYITNVSNDGIWVHPNGNGPSSSTHQAVSTTTGWHISDVLEYFKTGASWIKLWVESSVAKLRLGLENGGHAIFDSSGMEVIRNNNSIAKFGQIGRIGIATDGHAEVSKNGYSYNQGTTSVFAVEAYGSPVYVLGTVYDTKTVAVNAGATLNASNLHATDNPEVYVSNGEGKWIAAPSVELASTGYLVITGASSSVNMDGTHNLSIRGM